jgi:membrane-associated phospholipid phosphatase
LIAWAPGSPVWNLTHDANWLTRAVIALTIACVIATPILLLFLRRRPQRLRVLLAIALGLILLVLARKGIAAISFVPRPFAADHFRPLYPHPPDTSFPSATTGYFAVVAVPVACVWRKLGWVFAAITLEVAFGCVYVGVHYITDVLGGASIGAGCGGAAWLACGVVAARRRPRPAS